MKANELTIGDWVYSTFCDKPCKVIGIEQYESEYVNVKVTNVTGAKDINSLYFIPLTAEILQKNGFVESGMFYRLSLDYYGVFINEITESIWRFQFYNHECPAFDSTICIGYVHELQHALRLCGIDKEIVL